MASERWQAVRHAALQRCGYRCEACGQFNRSLDAHHWKGYANLGKEQPEDVMMLDRACHDAAHNRMDAEPRHGILYWIIQLLWLIFLWSSFAIMAYLTWTFATAR